MTLPKKKVPTSKKEVKPAAKKVGTKKVPTGTKPPKKLVYILQEDIEEKPRKAKPKARRSKNDDEEYLRK